MIGQPQQRSQSQRIRFLILRWLINTLAIFVAVLLVPGITFAGPGWQLGIVALVFGLVNVALRPILTLLTCPLMILTLGLFGLVINALLLVLTAQIARSVGVQFMVDGFWPAVLGGLVISLVSLILNILAQTDDRRLMVRVEYKSKDEDQEP